MGDDGAEIIFYLTVGVVQCGVIHIGLISIANGKQTEQKNPAASQTPAQKLPEVRIVGQRLLKEHQDEHADGNGNISLIDTQRAGNAEGGQKETPGTALKQPNSSDRQKNGNAIVDGGVAECQCRKGRGKHGEQNAHQCC